MSLVIESCKLEELCATLGKSEKLLLELREKFQEWLKLQPHLPQDASPNFLENILLGTKLSLERAKHKLDMFYTLRGLVPELFAGQDPRSSSFKNVQELVQIVGLPKLTPQNERVFILRPSFGDYSKISGYDLFRYVLMMEEIIMTESRSLGSIYVYDHLSLSVGFLALITPMLIKKGEVVVNEALAKRIAGIHFLNAAPLTQNFVNLLKKVLKPKLAARVHTYSKGSYEAFQKFVPKSILPKDYGGDAPSMTDLAEMWSKKMHEKRDWFLEQEMNLVNESLRPGPSINGDELFGVSGTFRKLDLD